MTETRKPCPLRTSGAQQAFQARMEAQCEAVEQYRVRAMQNEGRQLSLDEAAKEWIERFADRFATDNDVT